ncbi:Down syndrome cell adhesion molecule-like [Argiope bruennichi]|uniref:Down syndrome cell adhesion molecule-like n=1 Tax=Argiope bruennichi TaxID=94029 RepID=A0A8T0G1S9_ARGBR|nr:Down syndrome cell adhesion molecule-like [Argiope bruennichi]
MKSLDVFQVVRQGYQVQVYDEFVIRGNTAVLRCQVPSVVRDYVIVTTWEREDGVTIVSNVANGGRYSVLPNGELLIRNAMISDGFKSYRCLTKHILSGDIQLSSTSGRLIITDPQGTQPPRLSDTRSSINVRQGTSAELTCVAQAYPLPNYKWYKKDGVRLVPVSARPGVILLSGSLYFQQVNVRDSGTYVCVVNNSAGEKRMESTLTVTAPLSAHLHPKRILVDAEKPVTLKCNISGYPVDSVTWMKDTRALADNSGRVRMLTRDIIHINSVGREDRGVYQCFVRNADDSAQASAELVLGETAPSFHETFSERTLRPGPSVSFQCAASGTPLPQVTWSLDGYPVPDNDRVRVGDYVSRNGDVISHVNISSVRIEDGGLYSCVARNDVGEIRHSGRLNVYGPPMIRPMPDLSVVAGESTSIQCRVAGYPIDEIMWEKDGRRLPTNRRQQVFPNGTLLIEQVQRHEDEGVYVCSARASDSPTVDGSLKVTVKEKPVIMPFSFPSENLKEGMKIYGMCAVSAGDPPFHISWLKDNRPLSASDTDITIQMIGQDFSSLSIDSATTRHSGHYTCVVKNDVATVNYTATLTVHDASARDYRPISTSYHHQIFENGSLTIQDVTHEDAGYYLCQATNGIGPGLSSVVTLSVNESPRFETKFRTQMVKKGDDVSLTCAVSGDPPLSITWTRDKQPLNLETEPRFQVSQTAMGDSRMKSVLRVTSVGRVDSALYTCLASNMYGQDDTNIQLIVQEQPDAPREVQISETGSRLVRLSWEPPFSGNSLITKYILHIRENGSAASMSRNISVPGTNTSADISDLRPAKGYDVYLIAENAIGASGPGRTFHFKTEEEVPDGPPTAVRAEAIGPDALRISWELPEKHLRNGNIKGFYVGYKDANSSEPYQYKTVDIASRTQKETRETTDLRGLNPYSFYSIVLQAFNLKGAGPRSDPVVAMTMEDVPSVPPQQVDCMALTSQTIKVTWQSPPASAVHGVLKGYKVFYRSVDDWHEIEDLEVLVNAPEKETLLKNLEKYTNYSISVLAFTGRGDGVLSEPIHCRTMEDVPSPPADIKALPMLPDAILLSWQPPAQPNGILQQYTLYQRTTTNGRQETKKHTLSPSQHYYEALRLERSKRYEFWVTSSTSAGESEGTRVLSQTTSDTIPARIASFSQQVITRRKSSVQLPCKAVGIPAAEKLWTFKGQAIRDRRRTKFLNNGSLLIEDVDDDDAGNYTCRVQNVYGADEIAFMLVVRAKHLDGRALPAPSSVTVVTETSSSLELKWTMDTRGRIKTKGFIIRHKREYGQWEETRTSSKVATYTLQNLQCGTKYYVYVAAVGKNGEGEPSEVITAKTEGNAPVAPRKDNFIISNSTSLVIQLRAWEDGGCGIKSFVVRYKRLHTTEWKMAASSISQQQEKVVIRDLSPGTWYSIRVTAHNVAGSTVAEYEVATLTLDGSTVAPILLLESRESINIWEDVNIIVPIVAAVIALTVVIGVAVCVCVKKRHGAEDYYERRGENSNTTPLMSNQPAKKSTDGTNAPIRETSMYQTCGPKASLPSGNQDPNATGEQGHYYEDDITPYATFRLPGCESDTESSHETVREMQTFGHQQYSRRSYPDHSTAHVQEQLILSQDIAQYQKIVECPTYDANFPSVRPSIGVYSEPKFRGEPGREECEEQESAAAREKRLQHKELYRRWICLIEPYWAGETMESDVDAEYERTELVEDLLLKQEMSEAECDWDRNECY